MAYLTEDRLRAMGFRSLGRNVRVSDKASIYGAEMMEIGNNSRIDDFCVLSGKVVIGRNVHVAVFCNMHGGTEGITLEDFSGLAFGCHVFASSDDYSGASLTNPTVPAKYKREIRKSVRISRHSIIGTNAVIFPGVTVAEGCSIGALSLVTQDTEPWSVYVGIPARKIKDRKRDLLVLEKEYLQTEG
ncbi:MAG TPA: acyltransferase [Candidatus Bipolaricaulis anaerobius]|nr:acyltransferase [Candidatus Bipolaricaulis anaerobius]HNS24031.1 acyltransferase [Candidatus Bipolaricaulis anaerobius]